MEFNLLQIPSYLSVIIFFVVIFSQVDLKSTLCARRRGRRLSLRRMEVLWGGEKESDGLGGGQTEVRMRTGRDRRGQRDGRRQKNLLPSHS